MVKNRIHMHIHCNECPVSHLCIPHTLKQEEIEKVDTILHKFYVIAPAEHLYYQHQPIRFIFAVYSGVLKEYVVDEEGNERINHFYYPGDLLALESLFARKYMFSAAALQQSQLCAIPVESLFQLMQKVPALLQRFIYLLSHKMQNTQHIPITTNARRRISAFLLDTFYRLQEGKPLPGKEGMDLPMSQCDISNLLGLAHETVNRVFHAFQEEGMIKLSRKKIYITNAPTLKRIANYSAEQV